MPCFAIDISKQGVPLLVYLAFGFSLVYAMKTIDAVKHCCKQSVTLLMVNLANMSYKFVTAAKLSAL